MKLHLAVTIIKHYQEWRQGKIDEMVYTPRAITEALNVVIKAAEGFRGYSKTSGSAADLDEYTVRGPENYQP